MIDGQKSRRVVIAGGGTTGWLAAAALSQQLGALLDIILVESEEIGTIGVGESTIPTVRAFHRLIGLDEQRFMAETGATFKLGIAFENWARIGDRYIHAFGETGQSTWMGAFHNFWLQAREAGFGGDFGDYCLELQAADAGRFAIGGTAPELSYAYHLDAGLYARHLRAVAEGAGTRRIEGVIERVEQDASGDIAALILRSGKRIEGDLFIDCTGFRALLIGQTLGSPFENWRHWLPTDSAVVTQTRATGPAMPYTRAIAHGAGWRWRIPLQHRVGNGLVYDSRHLSADEAKARLIAEVEGEMLFEPRLIRFEPGCRREAWRGNCVALGLAGGFVEPLESTAIHLSMIAITRLLQMFPFDGNHAAAARRFNAQGTADIERIRDFIVLHYVLTERDDTAFWRAFRTMAIPESLQERIELFRENGIAYQDKDELFRVDSWAQVMVGQRLLPNAHHRMAKIMGETRLRQTLDAMRADVAGKVAALPAHEDFLQLYCPAAVAAVMRPS
ncbi:tryptophan halogenase family protein [Sphingomonas sp. PB2P12]|uniref:tryptophan halogenase family protein n=1 Tax=Sphingomonas sandaracina TaxID=3096157 RepID=UPI002FC6628D